MTKKKKPYYPNNWSEYSRAPSHWFDSIPYEDFVEWKLEGWEIPSSIQCIIRERNLITGKVKEHIYRTHGAAKNKVKQIMDRAESEFTIVDAEAIHHLSPNIYLEDPYDDPLA